MTSWKQILERRLSESGAPPVLTLGELSRAAGLARETRMPDETLHAWIRDAIARKRLEAVTRGVYLNRFVSPEGRLADAAAHVRRDAIVSLQTALDEVGLLNNPPVSVTAVVPLDSGSMRPRVGRVQTAAGTLQFHAMPRALLEAGEIEDRLDLAQAGAHPRASPEKALLDWLYLARSPRSPVSPPALHDVDHDSLDKKRLMRLANAMKLKSALALWLSGQFTRKLARTRPILQNQI